MYLSVGIEHDRVLLIRRGYNWCSVIKWTSCNFTRCKKTVWSLCLTRGDVWKFIYMYTYIQTVSLCAATRLNRSRQTFYAPAPLWNASGIQNNAFNEVQSGNL